MSASLHIVCPGCNAINKLPTARPAQQARCGSCHLPLFNGMPIELSSANFARHVSRNGIPVLVDFWASWCGPCKIMAPAFEQAARELQPEVRLAKLNTESEQAIAAQYGIRSIPTLVLFREGREIARIAGAMDLGNLVRWTRSNL